MQAQWSDYTNFGISLFALLDPFGVIPFILLYSNKSERAIRTLAIVSSATVIVVLTVAHFVGVAALKTLGTSLPSFQIAGGIVLLLTGISMLFGPAGEDASKTSKDDHGASNYLGIAVSPLGIPFLAGAGTITKVIIDSHPGTGIDNDLHTIIIIVLVAIASGAVLASSSLLVKRLGNGFFSVMARIAGLITIAVAVEMMVKGVSTHVHLFIS